MNKRINNKKHKEINIYRSSINASEKTTLNI
jgi:hypothetical protein